MLPLPLAFSWRAADEVPFRHGVRKNIKGEDMRHSTSAELVQSRPEVVQDDTIGEALEYKSKFPERVDDAYGNDGSHGENVDNDADHAEAHAEKQDAEPGGDLDYLEEAKLVAESDVVEEIDDGEYPPGIARGRKGQQTGA
jgi:hypothetical protein